MRAGLQQRREYLILLSISETCKNKGVRFLNFLLSEETDVDLCASRSRRYRQMMISSAGWTRRA